MRCGRSALGPREQQKNALKKNCCGIKSAGCVLGPSHNMSAGDVPRDVRCPVCAAGCMADHDARLQARCAAAGVAHPERFLCESTVRAAVVDYASAVHIHSKSRRNHDYQGSSYVATTTLHHYQPREACCNSLTSRLVTCAGPPSRIAAWQPSWNRFRCAESIELADFEVPGKVTCATRADALRPPRACRPHRVQHVFSTGAR